jgi:tetratricopeptide (TPR) repeat protein
MCATLAAVLLAAYVNHFENGFHFDDSHTVVGNPSIRTLANVPKFFVDPRLFSTLPDQQAYRPVTLIALTVDYRIGGGLSPFWFQLSTFLWLVVQVVLMFFLFRLIMDAVDPHPWNAWTTWVAAAWYGVHPACAETVNYVIQRADVLSTVGIVASVWIFACFPERRRQAWYLIPALLATLAKPTALTFPAMLLAYAYFIESPGQWRTAFRVSIPGIVLAALSAGLQIVMTPSAFHAGSASALLYWATQPWVALHYFQSFFLPTSLTADSDWTYVPGVFSAQALAGYVFVGVLLFAIVRFSRVREGRPVAFGLAWFLLGLLPTAIMPLPEVRNDDRMFLPFVGLALAVVWAIRLLLVRWRVSPQAAAAFGAIVLTVYGVGTLVRNRVWHDDESLWADVVVKSPRSGRGLMNYGLIFMDRGDYTRAISLFERALPLIPDSWALEMNLGVTYGSAGRGDDAERHFRRAVALAPTMTDPHFSYARWLAGVGRRNESAEQLEAAIQANPRSFDSRHLLMAIYSQTGNWTPLENLARDTLRIAPQDETAKQVLAQSADRKTEETLILSTERNELVDSSYRLYQEGRYEEAIAAAKKSLAAHPEDADAYNNLSAAYIALHRWNDGIWSAMQAIRIQPDHKMARHNLAWAVAQKQRGVQ